MRILTPDDAITRLEALCARSEQCTYEIASKLRNWGIAKDEAQKIIRRLHDDRFVDDARFARAFTIDRMRFSGYGRIKIAMALAAKRIDRDIISEAIGEIDEEEYLAKLETLMRARLARTADADTYEGRTRLYRYGVQRGFESALVSQTLRHILRPQ